MTDQHIPLHASYPMGPKVREWMNISEQTYRGGDQEPSNDITHAFQTAFLARVEDAAISEGEKLADILEELIAMDLPLLAIKLVDTNLSAFMQDDFRSQLHLGNACMMVGEHARAEDCFRAAQKIVPEEPAPYVNLAQIYCHDELYDDAKAWCHAGLNIEPNNTRLWELLAWLLQKTIGLEGAKEEISNLANKHHSWAGTSLAADLRIGSEPSDLSDVQAKLGALEPFFNEGVRDHDFLIEYTAILGSCGQYEKIPAILWQVEKSTTSKLPWQLRLHAIQAFMGLGRDDQALESIIKLSGETDLPVSVRSTLDSLKSEITGNSI
jgi:tetratricopeptide (TPR) repeat protein